MVKALFELVITIEKGGKKV